MKQAGYTLIEIMVTVGIFAILAGIISINFIRPQTQANVTSSSTMLFSDLKNQQIRAMIGDATNQSISQAYGIRFNGSSYILFQGTSYNAGSTSNVVVPLHGATVSTTFPSSQVVFSRISGEVASFNQATNSITITAEGNQKVLTVNRYGSVIIQ